MLLFVALLLAPQLQVYYSTFTLWLLKSLLRKVHKRASIPESIP